MEYTRNHYVHGSFLQLVATVEVLPRIAKKMGVLIEIGIVHHQFQCIIPSKNENIPKWWNYIYPMIGHMSVEAKEAMNKKFINIDLENIN